MFFISFCQAQQRPPCVTRPVRIMLDKILSAESLYLIHLKISRRKSKNIGNWSDFTKISDLCGFLRPSFMALPLLIAFFHHLRYTLTGSSFFDMESEISIILLTWKSKFQCRTKFHWPLKFSQNYVVFNVKIPDICYN